MCRLCVTPPKYQNHHAVSLIFSHTLGNAPNVARSYLVARFYTRRFSIVIYETCVCVLATVVLVLGFIDSALLTSDPILFAVTFVLVRWTWALCFERLNCFKQEHVSFLENHVWCSDLFFCFHAAALSFIAVLPVAPHIQQWCCSDHRTGVPVVELQAETCTDIVNGHCP